jgi:hypothetical protein
MRDCPICGHKDARILDYPDLVSCPICDFVYNNTNISQSQYDDYYAGLTVYEREATQPEKERYSMVADFLNGRLDKSMSILDVGFSNGEILSNMKNKGFDNLFGLDPNKVCVDRLQTKGITAYQGTIMNNSIGRKFDAVILSHILEHIVDLTGAMKNIYTKWIYAEVPDLSHYYDSDIKLKEFVNYEHINHFCLRTLTKLLEQFGFKIEDSGTRKTFLENVGNYPSIWIWGAYADSN